ncbi:hypothetical protein XENOCAPTIV_010753 [Xenoophorus captivus]|uniref:Uncharacterized protein n=1 Tax=Xenoophorus captivus TaxID=1517983 RepID=A0ABV0Q5R6_9TELE
MPGSNCDQVSCVRLEVSKHSRVLCSVQGDDLEIAPGQGGVLNVVTRDSLWLKRTPAHPNTGLPRIRDLASLILHTKLTNDGIPQVLRDDAHVIKVHKVQVVFHRGSYHLPQHFVVAVPRRDHQHCHTLLPQLSHRSNHIPWFYPISQPHQHSWEAFTSPVRRSGSQHPLLSHFESVDCVGVPPEGSYVFQSPLEAILGNVSVEAKLQAWLGTHLQQSYSHLILSQRKGEQELRQEGEHAGMLVGRHTP